MKKLIISGALALATALGAAVPASAATTLAIEPTTPFSNSSKTSGSFADSFVFSIPDGFLNGTVVTIALNDVNATITDFALDGVSGSKDPTTVPGKESWTIPTTFLQAVNNPHTLSVTGTWGASGGSYAGTLNFAAAVPEPASWALMIGGVGLTGGALRRRTLAAKAA